MDLITQALLGAAIGQAGYQKKLGKKALGVGALVGMLPDADVIYTHFHSNPFAEFIYHRGFTHSLFFAPLIAPILGYLIAKLDKAENIKHWIWLCFWALITHPLLDVFTVYGTQLLNPISNHRFTIAGVSIVDPFYSVPLLLTIMFGLIFNKRRHFSQILASITLLCTSAYLFFCVEQNDKATLIAKNQLIKQNIQYNQLNSYTTLLQPFLRRIVVHRPNDIWIGFTSTWGAEKPIKWHKITKTGLEELFKSHEQVMLFDWFTSNDMIFETTNLGPNNLTLKIFDGRFGYEGETIKGFWGIETQIDKNGKALKPFVRFRQKTKVSISTIKEFYIQAFINK